MKDTLKQILKPTPRKMKFIITVGAIGLFFHYCVMFWSLYRIQSPILIELRPPVVSRYVSGVPDEPSTSSQRQAEFDNTQIEVITPTPTPTPSEQSGVVTGPQDYIIAKIRSTFKEDPDTAVAVALAENTTMQYDRWSYSGCCVGIFQIHTVHIDKFDGKPMEDVDANIEVAYKIYKQQGWTPWEAYTNGAYLKYMN